MPGSATVPSRPGKPRTGRAGIKLVIAGVPFPNPSTQFKSGEEWTGNALGRPRKGLITDIAVRKLMEPHPKQPEKSRAEVIAEKWLDRAEDGEDFSELLTRVEGKPTDKLEIDDKREPTVVELPEKDLHAEDQASTGTANEVPE